MPTAHRSQSLLIHAQERRSAALDDLEELNVAQLQRRWSKVVHPVIRVLEIILCESLR